MSEKQTRRVPRAGWLRILFCAALFGVLAAVIAISGIAAPSAAQPAVSVAVPEQETGFRIASASTHTLAVSEGALYGWGTNHQGQLPGVSDTLSAAPVKLAVSDVADAAASANRTLTVSKNGELRVYGLEPTDPLAQPQTGKILATDAASVDACDTAAAYVSKSGALYTWGLNYSGMLGNDSEQPSSAPVQIFESGVKKVCVGGSFMAALMQDGSVYAWGDNTMSQLGGGNVDSSFKPVKIATGMADISAGRSHLLLLSTNGVLSGCGNNAFSQLGLGDGTLNSSIRQILTGIVSISAGSNHCFAVSADGETFCWGFNVSGQLGNGATETATIPTLSPNAFTRVFAGEDRTFAVRADGKIASFGDNTNYVLGKTDGSDSLLPMIILDSKMNWIYEAENPVSGPASYDEYLQLQDEQNSSEPADGGQNPDDQQDPDGQQPAENHVIDNPNTGESVPVETKAKAFITGYGDGLFRPDDNVTRAQFLTMVVTALYPDYDSEKDYGSSQFDDVADKAWYRNVVAFAEQADLVHGDQDGHFRPNDPITKADAAVLVSLALQLDTESAIPCKFQDVNTERWYAKHVDALTALGIVSGDPEGFYYPGKFIRRSEAVTMVARALGYQPDDQVKASLAQEFAESPFDDVRPGVWYYAYVLRGLGYVA